MKKILSMVVLLLLLFFIGVILYNQESIVHPKRRVLQAYHYEWLNNPKEHSMQIIRDNKHKDVLIVKRDETVALSKRSQKVLTALQNQGYEEETLKKRGVIVMFHGKNGRKEDLLPVAERYITAGFTCVLVDLPAHGDSPQTETKYVEKLDEMAILVARKYVDIWRQPIYFWGMSLGGRYAILAASKYDKKIYADPQAVVLVSTFDKLSYVLKEKSVDLFGRYLGKALYKGLAFSLKLFYDFDPEKIDSYSIAKKMKIPVFELHGKKDKLIGYKHGENLFKEFSNKKSEFHLDEKGDHHNILVTDYPFYLKSILFLLGQQDR